MSMFSWNSAAPPQTAKSTKQKPEPRRKSMLEQKIDEAKTWLRTTPEFKTLIRLIKDEKPIDEIVLQADAIGLTGGELIELRTQIVTAKSLAPNIEKYRGVIEKTEILKNDIECNEKELFLLGSDAEKEPILTKLRELYGQFNVMKPSIPQAKISLLRWESLTNLGLA